MKSRFLILLVGSAVTTAAYSSCVSAQDVTAAAKAAAGATNANVEVVTRGPVHEAFAAPLHLNAVAAAKVDKAPPAAIEEIAPLVRPAGNSVNWIPGYWGWDPAVNDYLWVSGSWRNSPPNHRWTPGYWNQVGNSYQWTNGFWVPNNQARIQYYAAPPQSQERGPNGNAPSADQFWIPGTYVPTNGKYVWQAGYWAPRQKNYVWTPARSVATAAGYIYVPGYWDYRLDQRGTLFAPARINVAANGGAAIRYTPQNIIPVDALQYHLFAQANANSYLFGDYYDAKYAGLGITPWYSAQVAPGIPDPIFGYYNWLYGASGSNYLNTLTQWNAHFVKNAAVRPAINLVDQTALVGKLGTKNLTQTVLAAPLTDIVSKTPAGFVNLTAADQTALTAATGGLRVLSAERLKLESGATGVLNAGAAADANANINLATTPLQLPAVAAPAAAVTAPVAPVLSAPGEAVQGVEQVVPDVGGGVVPDLPAVDLPGLPF